MIGARGGDHGDTGERGAARSGGVGRRTSLLPVAGAVGLESAGLGGIGDVLGCVVQYLGAGHTFGGTFGAGTQSAGPYVRALYRGYDTALARMVAEAGALGADGVVGVRLTHDRLDKDNTEFRALGTAVRSHRRRHARTPFTTDLAGQDVAKLLGAGWVPVRLVLGLAARARTLDWRTVEQAASMGANAEVSGYTELVGAVRAKARAEFASRASRAGAEGSIVSSMGTRSWQSSADQPVLLCAEASVFGTAIAAFGTGTPTPPTAVLPLRH